MPRPLLLLLTCAIALPLTACTMKRTLTIDSRPSGAHIWVNGELQQKTTPVDVSFAHYGRTTYRIERDGYASAAGEILLRGGADAIPVIDLPVEMFGPDRRWRRVIDLVPLEQDPSKALVAEKLARAEALREQSRRAAAEPDTPGRSAPGRSRP